MQIKKIDRQESKLFVSFHPSGTVWDKWIDFSCCTQLHTHTYDGSGHFMVGQVVEVCDDRGYWKRASISEVRQNAVRVDFHIGSENDDVWIPHEYWLKKIRSLSRRNGNNDGQFRRWQIPDEQCNFYESNINGNFQGAKAEKKVPAITPRTREITEVMKTNSGSSIRLCPLIPTSNFN